MEVAVPVGGERLPRVAETCDHLRAVESPPREAPQDVGDLPEDGALRQARPERRLPKDPTHDVDLLGRSVAAVRLDDDPVEPPIPPHGTADDPEESAQRPIDAAENRDGTLHS